MNKQPFQIVNPDCIGRLGDWIRFATAFYSLRRDFETKHLAAGITPVFNTKTFGHRQLQSS